MIQRLGLSEHRKSDKYLLITGATGFVGRYLLRDLLNRGVRVAALVRPSRRQGVFERIESVMQHWEAEAGRSLPRPVVLEGDIGRADLGLSTEDVAWVAQSCDRICHAAAVLQFFGERDSEPWTTNLAGTRQVVEFSNRQKLRQFHYLSTAYVCGQRSGSVREDELDVGQCFRNDYEHSKFMAERWVREHCEADEVTVYRPAVVIGDSRTGETSSYHGLFLYLRLLATLVPQQRRNSRGKIYTPIQLPLRGDEPRNLVPVDWVSQVLCSLMENRAAAGRTFHLAPDVRTTPKLIVESCYAYFDSFGVEYAGPDSPADGHESDFAKSYFANTKIYHDYELNDPEFDRTALKQFAAHLPCPAVDQAMIHRFMEFGKADQWGKSRRSPLVPQVDVQAWLRLFQKHASADHRPTRGEIKIAIDVLGPGGGQWTLSRDEARRWHIARGVQLETPFLLQVHAADLCTAQSEATAARWIAAILETARHSAVPSPLPR